MEADREANIAQAIEFKLVDIAERDSISEIASEGDVNVLLVRIVIALQVKLKALLPKIQRSQRLELNLTRNAAKQIQNWMVRQNSRKGWFEEDGVPSTEAREARKAVEAEEAARRAAETPES